MKFLRKKKAPVATSSPEAQYVARGTHPYLDPGASLRDQILALGASNIIYKIALCGLTLALVVVAATLAYRTDQVRRVPYFVETYRGEVINVERAAPGRATASERAIKSTLARWIEDARLITPDAALQRRAILSVYSLMGKNDPSTLKMGQHYRPSIERERIKRAASETVSTAIKYVIRQSAESWQVEWEETTYSRQSGQPQGTPVRWRALLTVDVEEIGPDTSEKEIFSNPYRIFIRDFNWAVQP